MFKLFFCLIKFLFMFPFWLIGSIFKLFTKKNKDGICGNEKKVKNKTSHISDGLEWIDDLEMLDVLCEDDDDI